MNEWTIITVIIALGGFILAILSPIMKLNTSITKLNVTIENLNDIVAESKIKIEDHEKRITKIEFHEHEHKED